MRMRVLHHRQPRRQVQHRAVAAVAVDDEDLAEAVMDQAPVDVGDVLDERLPTDRDGAGEVDVMRTEAMDDRREQDQLVGTRSAARRQMPSAITTSVSTGR
jgi:hypothetical protein